MLPPVRAISGSSGSYQNSASVSASAHLTGEGIYPGHAADADRDVNPNHSGKLNVLLLNGRDAVPEGLANVADALGRAIGLPRREGEVPSAYAVRLAATLAALPAGQKAEAEQELMKILRSLRLQLVIEALRNPTGPEAARIVALLEMAATTERDLPTLTVLTSYRQNGGAESASTLAPTDPAVFAEGGHGPVANPAAAPGAVAAGPDAILSAAAPEEAGLAAPAHPQAPDGDEQVSASPAVSVAIFPEDGEDGIGLARYHETDNIFSRTSSPNPASGTVADATPETTPVRRAMADLEPNRHETDPAAAKGARAAMGGVSVPTDARGLQSVLSAAFAAGESDDPLVQAMAAMDLLSGEPADAGGPARLPVARRDFASRPFLDHARPAPRPLPRIEDLPPIFGLTGWPDDVFIEPGLLPVGRLTETSLASTLVPHAGPEPDQAEQAYLLRGRGIAANDHGEHKAALEAAEQQLIRTADQAAGLSADRRMEPATRTERSAADQLLASALQLGIDPRQGQGFASMPYPVADERDDGPAERRGYRSSGDGGGEEPGEDGHPAEGEENAERHTRPVEDDIETDDGATDAMPLAMADKADPAYDYYQRMAGWN